MAKILIVDDDDTILLVFRTHLSRAGHTVETAIDGADALRKVAAFRPQLVLLDINMPMMSGFEVAKRLKENPDTRDIYIFIMTSLKQETNIKRGYQLGIDEYLTKPTNIAHLLLRINKFLEKKGLQAQR